MARLIGDAYIVVYPQTDQFGPQLEAAVGKWTKSLKPNVNVTPKLDKTGIAKIEADLKSAQANINVFAALSAASEAKIKAQLDAITTNLSVGTKVDPATLAATKASVQAFLDRNIVSVPFGTKIDPASLASAKASLDAYFKGIGTADVGVKLDPVSLAAAKASLETYLDTAAADIKAKIDPASLAAVQASITSFLHTQEIPIQVSTTQAVTRLEDMEAQVSVLQARLQDLRANVDDTGAEAKIAALQVRAAAFARTLAAAGGDADFGPLEASLLKMQAGYEALIPVQEAEDEEIKKQAGFFAALGLQGPGSLIHITDILNASLPQVKLYSGAIGAMYTAVRGGEAELPTLASHLVDVASSAHLTAEAAIEFTAIWAPAIIAVTAFGLAATPTVIAIAKQLQNMNTAAKGTGQAFQSLATQGQSVTAAVKPAVLELFGEGLEALKDDSGSLAPILAALGSGFDKLGAQAVVAFGSGGSGGIFKSGSADALALANSFTSLGSIIGTLFKLVPGYAEVLLGFGNDALGAAADVTKFIEPVLKIGIALHGAIFYGGLFGTAVSAGIGKIIPVAANALGGISNLAGKFEALGGEEGKLATLSADAATALDGVAGGPILLGIGLLVGAFAAVYIGLKAAGDAATSFNKSIEGTVQSSTVLNLQKTLAAGLAETTVQYVNAQKAEATATANLTGVGQAALATGTARLGQIKDEQRAVSSTTTTTQQYGAAISQLTTQQTNVNSNLQALASTYHTTIPGALAIANGAQVTSNQLMGSGAQNLATIKAQAGGYVDQLNVMTAGTGALNQALNALSVTQAAQITDAQKLSQAYAAWIGIVTGGDSGFASFEQAQTTLVDTLGGKVTPALVTATTSSTQAGQSVTSLGGTSTTASKSLTALAQGGKDVTTSLSNTAKGGSDVTKSLSTTTSATTSAAASADTLSVKIGNLTEKFSTAGAAMNGTSTASLAARQAFDAQIVSATGLYGSLQTMAAASGDTVTAQVALSKSGKDLVAQMLPLAAGSKEATAEVYALAQIAGYQGPDSFQKLAQWVGNTSGAEADLNKQQTILTLTTANLTAAAKNLASAVSQEVTQAEAAAIGKTQDFSSETLKLAQAFDTSQGAASKNVQALSVDFYNSLVKAGVGTTQATQQVNAFLNQMGATPAVIKQVDAAIGNSAPLANLANAAKQNAQEFTSLQGILSGTGTSYSQLFGELVKEDTGLVNNTSSADLAKQAFISFAENGLKLTQTAADNLWKTQAAQNLTDMASKAGTTKSAFVDYAENGLKLTTTQANTLWTQLRLQYLDTLATKAGTTESSFVALAKNGLGLTTTGAENLWTTMRQQYLDTLATKAGETETAFVGTAKQLGITQTAAEALWKQMQTLAAGSPYTANILVNASASGDITIDSQGVGANLVNQILVRGTGLASGGTIPGTSSSVTGDNHLAMVKSGELIIPSQHAPKFADAARKASIPGFSAGGAAVSGVASTAGDVSADVGTAVVNDVRTVTQAMIGSIKASQAAAAAAISGVGVSNTSALAALQSAAAKAGWTGAEWAALNNVEMREAGYSLTATNPSSGAYGLAQFINGPAEYALYGGDSTSPAGQAVAMVNYIKQRYGDPEAAWAHEQEFGWYSKGGRVKPHSAGGMVSEPVFGTGAWSGMPYSFAERGPEYAGPLSGNGTGQGMPGMTTHQAAELIHLQKQHLKLLAQMPYSQAQAINQAGGAGVRRGYFATSG